MKKSCHLRLAGLFSSAALLAQLAACSDPVGSPEEPPPSAAEVAQGFERIADSVSRASGPTAAQPFRGAADVLRLLGRSTTIKILVDGTPTAFEAVAQRFVFPPARCSMPPIAVDTAAMLPRLPMECFASLGGPMLIAWETQAPKRLLFIHADTGKSDFGFPLVTSRPPSDSGARPVFVAAKPPASASLFDQHGHFWLALAGSVTQAVTATKARCMAEPKLAPGSVATCALADFVLAFDAHFDAPPVLRPGTPGAGPSHKLSMPAQTVAGAVVTVTSFALPPVDTTKRPPVDSTRRPPGDSTKPPPADTTKRPPADSTKPPSAVGLLSSLAVGVDSGVIFHFKVHNPGPHSIVLDFSTAQMYDFMIRDVGMHDVWRWSAGKAFATMPHHLTLKAGESIVFSERWPAPTVHGRFVAVAWLASTTFGVEQWVPVSIP